jgi:hypothetical protein
MDDEDSSGKGMNQEDQEVDILNDDDANEIYMRVSA